MEPQSTYERSKRELTLKLRQRLHDNNLRSAKSKSATHAANKPGKIGPPTLYTKEHTMKMSVILVAAAAVLSASSYVNSHNDIKTLYDLFGNVQNLFGMLGVLAGVVLAWFGKSPSNGNGIVAKITGNGDQKLP